MDNSESLDHEISIQVSVGEKIRELRKSASMTSGMLCERVGISQGQLSKIENGKVAISIKTVSQLCQIFNRSLNYFFQEEDEILQVLGTLNVADGPEKEGFNWFADEIIKNTDNRIGLVVLEAYQIGPAREQVDFLHQGIIDLFIEDLDHFTPFAPEMNIFSLPYVFSDIEHKLRFLNSDLYRTKIHMPLEKKGIRFINPTWNWFRGKRRVLVSKTPVFSPDDLKGLKVRIYASEVLKAYWQNLGATPVFVPWSDVNNAMESGQIDVLPTHHALVYSLGFCKHAKFVTHIGDMPAILGVAMNVKKYQLLSPKNQASIKKASLISGEKFSNFVKDMEEKNEDLTMKAFGAVYINAGSEPWKKGLDHTREQLIHQGILSREIWQEVLRTR
jgi:TRAP-type C4-dicarboxylate transport system substrate-binding protein